MLRERSRAVIPALVALILVALATSTAVAQSESQSGDSTAEPPGPRPILPPINLELEAPSLDFTRDIAEFLNDFHDDYRRFKKELRHDYGLQYSMPVSIIPQWGTSNGGPGVVQLVYTPYVTWTPFTNTAFGSGAFTFLMQQTQFWTKANSISQQARLGLITPPNDQTTNLREYDQLMYTHTSLMAGTGYRLHSGNTLLPPMTATNMPAAIHRPTLSAIRCRRTPPRPIRTEPLVPMLRRRHQTNNSLSQQVSKTPPMLPATYYRRAASGPARTPISWLASGRRIFSAAGPTVSSGTASPRCRSSRATARVCRSMRCRISMRNGVSSCAPTVRAEPRPRSRPRLRGAGSTTIPLSATSWTRSASAFFGTRPI